MDLGRGAAHPLARRVLLALAHRSEADARVVFAALAERLGIAEQDGSRASALLASRRCADALGVEGPSAARYASWRASSPEGVGAPSLAQIRRIFGGNWSSATAALPRVAASDVLAHRLLARATFTDPDCVAALRRWHAETGARLEAAYCDWARAQRDGGSDVPSRIPASGDVFRRRFGSWALALQAAGIQCQRAAVTRRPFTPRQARHATREEIVVGLRQAYAAIGEPFSVTRYDAWVRQQAIEHAERLETFRIPGHRAAVPIFGSWGQAVAEALGDDRSAVAAVERRVRSFSDRELAAAWWACRRELKCVPSSGEYERWRHAEAERTGFREWPPCEGSIRTRLGDRRWGLACDRLQAAGEPDA